MEKDNVYELNEKDLSYVVGGSNDEDEEKDDICPDFIPDSWKPPYFPGKNDPNYSCLTPDKMGTLSCCGECLRFKLATT